MAGIKRSKQPVRKRGKAGNLRMQDAGELSRRYGGRFAATDAQGRIVAVGDTPEQALKRARDAGEPEAFVLKVPEVAVAQFL